MSRYINIDVGNRKELYMGEAKKAKRSISSIIRELLDNWVIEQKTKEK